MKKIKLLKAISPLLLIMIICSCDHKVAGVKKDFTTGLVTSYKDIEPAKVLLVMNDEVLNHTDIPIGEKFIIINDGVSGLVTKNGKVKVGCYLKIADKTGNILLEERDLFANNDQIIRTALILPGSHFYVSTLFIAQTIF